MLKLAAIDAGSNALRLAVGQVDTHHRLKILHTQREPIRLGEDVFSAGVISEATAARTVQAFVKFKQLIQKHRAVHWRAVATSAMRDAKNSQAVVQQIAQATGIQVEIIDGTEEARLIRLAVGERVHLQERTALLIDIGGGSAEISILIDEALAGTHCFALGAVRLLQRMKQENLSAQALQIIIAKSLSKLSRMLMKTSGTHPIDMCVGTGGNIEALAHLRKTYLDKKRDDILTEKDLTALTKTLKKFSYEERIKALGLRADRADVILPAALVLQAVIKKAGVHQVLIPYVGLKEGVLVDLVKALFHLNGAPLSEKTTANGKASESPTKRQREVVRKSVLMGRFEHKR